MLPAVLRELLLLEAAITTALHAPALAALPVNLPGLERARCIVRVPLMLVDPRLAEAEPYFGSFDVEHCRDVEEVWLTLGVAMKRLPPHQDSFDEAGSFAQHSASNTAVVDELIARLGALHENVWLGPETSPQDELAQRPGLTFAETLILARFEQLDPDQSVRKRVFASYKAPGDESIVRRLFGLTRQEAKQRRAGEE